MFELLQKIREVESKWTQSHTFKRYQNYYVPEELVKNAKRVISFGVGTDVRFEKLMCADNNELNVRLFDPTPMTAKFWNVRLGKEFFDQYVHLFKPVDGPQEMPTDVSSCMQTESLHQFRSRFTLAIHTVKNRNLTTKNTALFQKQFFRKYSRGSYFFSRTCV